MNCPSYFLTVSLQSRMSRRRLSNPRTGLAVLFVVTLIVSQSYALRCGDNALQANQHHQQGIRLLSSGQFDQAVAAFEAALRSNADSAEIHNHLGLAWIGMNDLARAREQ